MKTKARERPILFSSPMVRAILSGAKTQTRRVVKQQIFPPVDIRVIECHDLDGGGYGFSTDDEDIRCPYGSVGDSLWVRETWGAGWDSGAGFYTALPPTGREHAPEKYFYRADGYDESNGRYCWRPSIHMPRVASRLTLRINDVRVERLHDISEADAKAEGVEPGCLTCGENCVNAGGCGYCRPDYRDSFCGLWKEINGADSWEANPWVWVVSFERVKP